MPKSIPAGPTTFRLVNDGKEFHHLSLIKRQMLLAKWRREHKDDAALTREVSGASTRSG